MTKHFANDLTKGNITEKIINFSVPFIIGNLCMQLYNYIDAIVVGKFLGKEALAAVGASSPVIFILISFISGITIGGGIIVSKYFAQGDISRVSLSASTISTIIIVLGIVLTVIGLLCSEWIMGLINLPPDVLPFAVEYLSIYILGMLPIFGYYAVTSFLRGVGNSIIPLYFLITTSILNILLNLLFVVVFEWGITSVAWATVISQSIAYIFLQAFVNIHVKMLSLNIFKIKFNRAVAIEAIRLGVPASVQQVLVALGTLALISIVSTFGTDVLAAFTSAQRVLILIMVIPINLSLALTNFTAQNFAVNRFDRIEEALKVTLKLSLVVCFAILILISMFSTNIIAAFSYDSNIINIGKQYLLIIAMSFWIFNIMMIFTGVIRGLGNTIVPMLIALFSLWIVKIPIAELLSGYFNEVGVWLSEPISWTVGVIISVAFYIRLRRKQNI